MYDKNLIMRKCQKIVLATYNRRKLEEFRALFNAIAPEYDLFSADEFIKNIQHLDHIEVHDSYRKNAFAKARAVHLACHYPCLADDSGLEVTALQGAPGVYSKHYATQAVGVTQQEANINKLISALKGQTDRSARFICHLVFLVEGTYLEAQGVLEGTISLEPWGSNGFGYDSIFIPSGTEATLASLSFEQKQTISHRFIALKSLLDQIKNLGIKLARP